MAGWGLDELGEGLLGRVLIWWLTPTRIIRVSRTHRRDVARQLDMGCDSGLGRGSDGCVGFTGPEWLENLTCLS
jgi:hypothetical protein